MERKQTWTKKRHRIITALVRIFLAPYTRLRYGVKIEPFRAQGDRPYLVLLNHQTPFDQFFVGVAFRGPVYYMATEDIFSLGWVSDLIRWLVAPIPIRKQTTDVNAVMTCMRVAKEGGTLCIAPEGNRSYSGRTEYFNPAIAPLIRKLKLPVALFRLEGGYGVQPRWSDCIRKGRMRCGVTQVIEPEEYAAMTNEQLCAAIAQGLAVDEGRPGEVFRSRHNAEYLERAMYVCPHCGLSRFESRGNILTCLSCRRQVRYLPNKEFRGIGYDHPFRGVTEWYDYQKDHVNRLDLSAYEAEPAFTDRADFSEVIVYERKVKLQRNAPVALYGDRVTVGDYIFPFDEASAFTVLGRNKLNIYWNRRVFQLKGDARFNALKYVNFFYRYQNIRKGDTNGKFLGL